MHVSKFNYAIKLEFDYSIVLANCMNVLILRTFTREKINSVKVNNYKIDDFAYQQIK